MNDGVLLHALMADADFIDPEHDAANLAHGRPCESLVIMKRHEPPLNFDGLNAFSYTVGPAVDQVVPHVVPHDWDGGGRLLAHRICAVLGLQVELRERVETDAAFLD